MIDFGGRTFFVLADGPSAGRYKSLDKLRGRPVIALNAAIRRAPWAPYWASSERLFWRDHAPTLCPDYGGVKLSPHQQPPELRIQTLPGHGFGHLDDSPIAGRQWRGTSDYFALQVAHYWRAAQIGLVGLDLVPTNSREAGIFDKRRLRLAWLFGELSRRGVKVFTLTRGCTLGVPYWPPAKIPPHIEESENGIRGNHLRENGDAELEIFGRDRRRENRGWKKVSAL